MTAISSSRTSAEIASQPAVWRQAAASLPRQTAALPRRGERVAVVGCGTSWFMAQSYAVLRETGGVRTVVSHDNKWTKGLLARALCEGGARSVRDVAEAGRSVADRVEVDGRSVDLVLHGLARARGEPDALDAAQR